MWKTDPRGGIARRQTAIRIFLTGWLLFCAHFASNVAREVYLGVAIGDDLTVRVDEYLGLHPDLFEIPGRGSYINSNPGASLLGAIPYSVARPALNFLFRLRPGLIAAKPPAEYDDPRPNRTRFMNESRARGLDVKLGLAAAVMQVGLMAPASAFAMVLVYWLLCFRLKDESQARWLALLYGFGTPIFFRTAFLNQNLLLAHFVLMAFAAVVWPPRVDRPDTTRREFWAGLFLGLGLLCDYSAAPLVLAFGVWSLATRWSTEGGAAAVRGSGRLLVGLLIPVAILLSYQWAAFGVPWFPAQRYMPATEYSVLGWNGMTVPALGLLWDNLVDPRYGLLAFCPLLALAFAAPFARAFRGAPARAELGLLLGGSVALLIFNSANQFSNLQFNTGVRYMLPAVPLLFFALVPVLLRVPRVVAWAFVLPSLVISWSVSMAREDVFTSLTRVLMRGLELPWLTVLHRMASGYAPFLADGVSPLAVFVVLGALVWLIWRGGDPLASLAQADPPIAD